LRFKQISLTSHYCCEWKYKENFKDTFWKYWQLWNYKENIRTIFAKKLPWGLSSLKDWKSRFSMANCRNSINCSTKSPRTVLDIFLILLQNHQKTVFWPYFRSRNKNVSYPWIWNLHTRHPHVEAEESMQITWIFSKFLASLTINRIWFFKNQQISIYFKGIPFETIKKCCSDYVSKSTEY
jgi:hypothetical protein